MRFPAVAGRFYPADPASLRDCIRYCFEHRLGPGMPSGAGNSRRIRGIVVPHAGYLASGMNAAHAYRALAEDGPPELYVVIGPDHYGTVRGTSVCPEPYLTPFGPCRTDEEVCSALLEDLEPSMHPYEHSVEVQIPFIQSIDPDPAVVSIVMGRQHPDEVSRVVDALRRACEDRDAVFVASTDLCHYVPKETAERLDSMVASRIEAMDPAGLYSDVRSHGITMCGYGPAMAVMELCRGCAARVLSRSDSFDSLGADRDSVVDYLSAAMSQ